MPKCKVQVICTMVEIIDVNTKATDWNEACKIAIEKFKKKHKNTDKNNFLEVRIWHREYNSFLKF